FEHRVHLRSRRELRNRHSSPRPTNGSSEMTAPSSGAPAASDSSMKKPGDGSVGITTLLLVETCLEADSANELAPRTAARAYPRYWLCSEQRSMRRSVRCWPEGCARPAGRRLPTSMPGYGRFVGTSRLWKWLRGG